MDENQKDKVIAEFTKWRAKVCLNLGWIDDDGRMMLAFRAGYKLGIQEARDAIGECFKEAGL